MLCQALPFVLFLACPFPRLQLVPKLPNTLPAHCLFSPLKIPTLWWNNPEPQLGDGMKDHRDGEDEWECVFVLEEGEFDIGFQWYTTIFGGIFYSICMLHIEIYAYICSTCNIYQWLRITLLNLCREESRMTPRFLTSVIVVLFTEKIENPSLH